jgi:hypothetical protein
MFFTEPFPKSKKNESPLPNSTIIAVPACLIRGGHGAEPTNEIRISSGPSSSVPGRYELLFVIDGVGRKYGGIVKPDPGAALYGFEGPVTRLLSRHKNKATYRRTVRSRP